MNILSLQSWVAYGHVGNAAAVFPLQRLGAEVWAIHTVQFSNHPGYGGFAGEAFGPAHIRALVDGIAARGALARCDAVLSGYIGDPAVGDAILHAVARARAANPAALYACDPVIGDEGRGAYVRPGVAAFFGARAVAEADILFPNAFELAALTGEDCATLAAAKGAARALRGRMRAGGRRLVLVTSVPAPGAIDMLLVGETCHVLRVPLLPAHFSGAGDALAALFLFHVLRHGDAVRAASLAASSLHGVLRRTHREASPELLLIAAQDEIADPSLVVAAAAYD